MLALLLSAAVLTVASVHFLSPDPEVDFEPYFGGMPPWLAASAICAAGAAALVLLHTRYGLLVILPDRTAAGAMHAAILAIPFIVSITVVDVAVGFSPDINVPWPQAAVFYPAMGLVAQLALIALPLAQVLTLSNRLARSWSATRRLMPCFVLVSRLEAGFQANALIAAGGTLALAACVTIQLFLFGLAQLYLFRRFDFVAMYFFRLVY